MSHFATAGHQTYDLCLQSLALYPLDHSTLPHFKQLSEQLMLIQLYFSTQNYLGLFFALILPILISTIVTVNEETVIYVSMPEVFQYPTFNQKYRYESRSISLRIEKLDK